MRCPDRQWRLDIGCGLVAEHPGRHVGVGKHMGLRCRAAWDGLDTWRLGPVWRGRVRQRWLDLSAPRVKRLP